MFPLLPLLGAATQSVVTVCACSGVGAYARKQGLLDKKGQKVMDKLVASIFLPCLILGKVTPRMTLEELELVWPMGVMCVCVVFYGLAFGRLVAGVLARFHPIAMPKYQGLIMVAIAFPNSFSVPLTLALALGDHPVLVPDGAEGGEVLAHRINVLFLMSYAIWVLARWSIGFPILSGAISFKEWRSKVLNPPVIATIVAAAVGLVFSFLPHDLRTSGLAGKMIAPVMVATEYAGRCSVPMILLALGARLDEATSEVWEAIRRFGYQPSERDAKSESSLVIPEVVGVAGKVDVDAKEQGTVELGITAESSDVATEGADDGNGAILEAARMPTSAYFAVLVFRQVIGPVFGGLVACWLLRDICGVTDRAALLVCMLQSAGPPMINISVMAGLSGNAEIETAKLLLLSYSVSVFTWTASIAVYLYMMAI